MRITDKTKSTAAVVCLVLAAVLFFASVRLNNLTNDLSHTVSKTEKHVARRLEVLDSYVDQAVKMTSSEFMRIEGFPDDMVLYHYSYDTLKSWVNQFYIGNDNIDSRHLFQNITAAKYGATSPLEYLTQDYTYRNIGPVWYIIKMITAPDGDKIVAALEVKNEIVDNLGYGNNGVNKALHISDMYSTTSLTNAEGEVVSYKGRPLFSIVPSQDTYSPTPFFANSILRWLAALFLLTSAIITLWLKRTVRVFILVQVLLTVVYMISSYWGYHMQLSSAFFSPSVYAGGEVLYSLGSLVLIIFHTFLALVSIYLLRDRIYAWVEKKGNILVRSVYSGGIIASICVIIAFIHYSLKSLIINSNISFDLVTVSEVSSFTIIVYFSYILLIFGVLMLLKMLQPVLQHIFGKDIDPFSFRFRVIYSVLWALYIGAIVTVVGFQKEENKVMVWSNRLAIDRDLELELRLRALESSIASDMIVPNLAELDAGNTLVLNRLIDSYFQRTSQKYDISVTLCLKEDPSALEYIAEVISGGQNIAPSSRFVYNYDKNGRSSYAGLFTYYLEDKGLVRMMVQLESKTHREDRGYFSIFGRMAAHSEIRIPEMYSYARFIDGKLVAYKGSYASSMVLTSFQKDMLSDHSRTSYKYEGRVHFINRISDSEIILVSRPQRNGIASILSYAVLFILIHLGISLLSLFGLPPREPMPSYRKSYKTKINVMLSVVLVSTMVILTLFSITFVIRRNDTNTEMLMASRINTIQALVESLCSDYEDISDLSTQEFSLKLEEIARTTKLDISVYTPLGRVINTTIPDAFDKMLIGHRLNEDAYYNIIYGNQRYFIHKERFSGSQYYSLYAPVFSSNGDIMAIVASPYADNDSFNREAIIHVVMLLIIFFILIFVSIYFSSTMTNALFQPLSDMSRQLKSISIDNLEYMHYIGDDEISVVVDAYNRMVDKLGESMKKVTQSERDKAWSEMARQVAHEIKNPLTPMQLAIQRLIRLKQRNVPDWDEKFYELSNVILEQISILTDTANEFSTFAKLYTEDPVEIDLDKLLQDQMVIFDNRENVKVVYIGLKNAKILAPRPQITRVFVNLISNAIQAVENMDFSGKSPSEERGLVTVCLRNSSDPGYYDVVIEDNGPGVSEENIPRLFTPNFTTKSSGTGLGLAISKNILEKCGGSISYQRSQVMKGACFTVRLQKLSDILSSEIV